MASLGVEGEEGWCFCGHGFCFCFSAFGVRVLCSLAGAWNLGVCVVRAGFYAAGGRRRAGRNLSLEGIGVAVSSGAGSVRFGLASLGKFWLVFAGCWRLGCWWDTRSLGLVAVASVLGRINHRGNWLDGRRIAGVRHGGRVREPAGLRFGLLVLCLCAGLAAH